MRYSFDTCLLDSDHFTLTRDGAPVPVEPQVFDLLHLLLRTPDRVVTRDEIIEVVWQGRIVSEAAISSRIAALRRAVGDDGKAQRIVRTVARRGLQMAVPVTATGQPAATRGPDADAALPKGAAPSLETQRIRYTRSPNGHQIAWAVTGSGPPLVMASFIGTDLEAEWNFPPQRALFDTLGARFTLVRYDPSGSGQSGRGMPEFDYDVQADELKAVADAAGVDRFMLYAESGGAMTAVHFASRYPEMVERLVLNGGYAEGMDYRTDGSGSGSVTMLQLVDEGWQNPDGAFGTAFLMAYLPDGPVEVVRRMAEIMRGAVTPEAEVQVRLLQNRTSLLPLLPRVICPTLLLHARNDRVHPVSEARKLAAGIPDAQLVTFDTANHLPLPDHPHWPAYISAMLDFFTAP